MLPRRDANHRSSLSPRLSHRPRDVGKTHLSRTVMTEPDENLGRIRPKERSDLFRHLQRVVHRKSLQGLHVEYAIVVRPFHTVLLVDTLPLTVLLLLHSHHHLLRAPEARINKREWFDRFVGSCEMGQPTRKMQVVLTRNGCESKLKAVSAISFAADDATASPFRQLLQRENSL